MKINTMDRRPLNFRDKPGFEITGKAKCPEAHIHGKTTENSPLGTFVTIVHNGVFSNTFKLQNAWSILEPTDFKGFVEKKKIAMKITFSKDGKFTGTGNTLDKKKNELNLEGEILPSKEASSWKGFFVERNKVV